MELRVVVRDGLLDHMSHKAMKMITSFIATKYEIQPVGMDLEGSLFELDDELCRKIKNDVEKRFKKHMRYIEVECL